MKDKNTESPEDKYPIEHSTQSDPHCTSCKACSTFQNGLNHNSQSEEHNHALSDDQAESSRQKVLLLIAIVAFVVAMLGKHVWSWQKLDTILLIIAWLLAGFEVIINAIKKLFSGFLLDEEFLMAVATIGAIVLGNYPEAAIVMILYQIGEALEDYAVGKSRQSITELLDIAAPYANLVVAGGTEIIDPAEIKIGDILEVRPGELVPTDAVVTKGFSTLDTSAITGESLPLEVRAGSKVISGSLNGDGLLHIRAETTYQNSTANRVMDMVEEASQRKSRSESFISRFARVYTPIVVILAILVSVLPPLLMDNATFSDWIYKGLTFLVISCPCALVISVPLAFVSGLGMASRHGVLIRGGNDLENLRNLNTLAFDKTGTLTKGKFKVIASHAEEDVDEKNFLALSATMELGFTHPIAESIVNYVEDLGIKVTTEGLSDITSLPGHGVRGVINGSADKNILGLDSQATVYLGNSALMRTLGLHEEALADGCDGQAWTISHVAIIPAYKDTRDFESVKKDKPHENARYLGHIVIRDELKEETAMTIEALRQEGVERLALLTGDNETLAREVAKEAGIDEVEASLLPQDKAQWMEEAKKEEKNGKTGFVGDGINDAPVLMTADLGIAMGGVGSDAAIEAADIVLMQDDLSALLKGLSIAKKTIRIARQNVVFTLAIKLLFMILSVIGFMPMWLAAFADVGVTILAVLNCFRVFYIPGLKNINKELDAEYQV